MKTTSSRARALTCALLATTSFCGVAAQPAAAQTLDTAPPVRSSVDENGVDVARGYFKTQVTDISIGPDGPGGLAFVRSFGSALAGGGSNFDLGIFPGTSQTLASVGGRSYAFTPSGSAFVSADGSGATLTKSGGTYTLTTEDGTVIVYGYTVVATAATNNKARGTSITYPSGEKITLTWVDATWCVVNNQDDCASQNIRTAVRLQSVSSSLGYQLHFDYGRGDINFAAQATAWKQFNGITAINTAVDYCDPAAHSCTFSQSWPSVRYAAGSVTDTRGYTTTYATPPSSFTITRPGSTSPNVTVSEDGNARITSVERDGKTWTYAYNPISSTTAELTVTDPMGHVRVYTSDTNIGLPTSIRDENNRTTEFEYYPSGLLKRVTADEDNYVEYTYDSHGNVTRAEKVTKPGTGLAPIVASAVYPCLSAPTCDKPQTTTDERGNTTDYQWDTTHGGLLKVTLPAPTPNATRPETRYTYEPRQAYVKNSAGAIVANPPVYRVTVVSQCQTGASCANTPDEVKSSIVYGFTGVANNLLPTKVTSGAGDNSLAATTEVTYDPVGNLLTVDGPLSGTDDTTRFRYDSGRLLTGTISPDPDGDSDPLPRRAVRTAYNNLGQPTKVEQGTIAGVNPDWANFVPAHAVETEYDSATARPVVQRLTANGTTYALTQTGYDDDGRVDCVAQRMNPAEFATANLPPACELDAPGTLAEDFGPDRIVKTLYDPGDRVTEVWTAWGTGEAAKTVATSYTHNGLVETVTDGENNKTTYEYDGHDRLLNTRYPVPAKGALTSAPTSGAGADFEQLGYESVAGGTRTSHLAVSFSNRAGETIASTYDALERLSFINMPGSELDVTYGYDLLGRMTSASQSGDNLTFAWDALGRSVKQSGASGDYESQYDLAGRRIRLDHPGPFFVTQEYNVTGEMKAIRESGTTLLATFDYDNLGRRERLTLGNGAVTNYQYDDVSRLWKLKHDLAGSDHDNEITLAYNPASQIVSRLATNTAYAWTGHGNGSTSYATDGLNRLISQTTGQATTGFGHDARSNRLNDGFTTYVYDSENKGRGVAAAPFQYDPLGRLAGIGSPLILAYENYVDNLIAERTPGSSSVERRHVFGPGIDEPLVWYEGSGTTDRRFLQADERGSIVAVSNGSGAVQNVNRYDEYGRTDATNYYWLSRFAFTGQRWFSGFDIYHYKNRLYDQGRGRFMQPDPIGYGAGMNGYAYVGGDPVNFSDPLGLTPQHLECTGTRICSNHDGGGGGSVQVFGDIGGYRGSGRGSGGSVAHEASHAAAENGGVNSDSGPGWYVTLTTYSNGNLSVSDPFWKGASDGYASPVSGGEAGHNSDGVELACFSPALASRCAIAAASALLMLNARIAARQLGLRIVTTVTLSGGRSGQLVKNLVGPANSVMKGQGARVFFTNGRGQVVRDITYGRAKAVQPGVGFVGGKVPPSNKELRILDAMVGR